jgi:LmbE family N-acetylglucosaminyl deacetylase
MQLSSLDQITAQYRHIYLQPHYDDAALSCGGTIALQTSTGQRALIVTVFGDMPSSTADIGGFARQVQRDQWGMGDDPAEVVRQRRQEDTAAADLLGADTLWLDFPEALYRGAPALYETEEALFGAVHARDQRLEEDLEQVFLNIHERAPLAVLYAPLGIGHHVDHQICCSAADRLAQRKIAVKFFEDFPYVAQPHALQSRQNELQIAMEPEVVEVSGLTRLREEAIAQYASQIRQLFGSRERLHQQLRDYSTSIRRTYPGIEIERYWRW